MSHQNTDLARTASSRDEASSAIHGSRPIHQGTVTDPESGAYDQHFDYPTSDGVRHHRERVGEDGTREFKTVDVGNDGSERVHREFHDPATGTHSSRDFQRS